MPTTTKGIKMSEVKLPEYQSIKVVGAAKIVSLSGTAIGVCLHKSMIELEVGQAFIARHQPEIGGYYVRYHDGYESYSPAEAFKKGYLALADASLAASFGVSFGIAIELLKEGERIARKGWNGKGMWLELQSPDADSDMTLPYIYMRTADGQNVPWLASQTDMLSEDWVTVK